MIPIRSKLEIKSVNQTEVYIEKNNELAPASQLTLDSTFLNVNNISMTDRQTDRQCYDSITKKVFQL